MTTLEQMQSAKAAAPLLASADCPSAKILWL